MKRGVRVVCPRSAQASRARSKCEASEKKKKKKKKKKTASLPSFALCFRPLSCLLFDCSRILEYAKIRTVLQFIHYLNPASLHCETIGFFFKISKEIGEARCKSRMLRFQPRSRPSV